MTERSRTTLTREAGFRFRVHFDEPGVADLVTDEPPPLGQGTGPDPLRMLAAAIGNCLAASLLFCLDKARVEVGELSAEVDVDTGRDARGRLRVQAVSARLRPVVTEEGRERMTRCLGLFEDFCTVTESVRRGIDVGVTVEPAVGEAASHGGEERP